MRWKGPSAIETVIENTLNLARFTPPVLHEEQINELVRQVLGFVKISVQQKEVHFDTALTPELPPIHVDAKQIQQVVLNIVQNAIDASIEGGRVHVSTGIEPWSTVAGEDTEAVVIRVRDNGKGNYRRAAETSVRTILHYKEGWHGSRPYDLAADHGEASRRNPV